MIIKFNLFGNENIGVFGFSCDDYCLVGSGIEKRAKIKLKETLKVPIHEVNISQAKIVHTLCIGNKNGILVPKIIKDDEMSVLKTIRDVVEIIPSELSALGNNILCNDKAALYNPEYDSKIGKIIKDVLDVEAIPFKIIENEPGLVGTHAICNNKGVLIHPDAKDEILEEISEIMKIKAEFGTLNTGFYPGAGAIVNSNGAMVGNESTGPEIMHLGLALELN